MRASHEAAGNVIHPTALLEGDVRMGARNVIHPYCVLTGPLEIGDDNVIGPLTVIGSPGQNTRDRHYDSTRSKVVIGSGNIIREHVAIQKPYSTEMTFVGDNTYLMHNVHIPHDATIQSDAVIAPGVVLAGQVTVMRGANIAVGCSVHQHGVVGPYAIAGMGSVVVKNIKPFSRYVPDQPVSVNQYAIAKFGWQKQMEEIVDYVLNDTVPLSSALIGIVEDYNHRHISSGRGQY